MGLGETARVVRALEAEFTAALPGEEWPDSFRSWTAFAVGSERHLRSARSCSPELAQDRSVASVCTLDYPMKAARWGVATFLRWVLKEASR